MHREQTVDSRARGRNDQVPRETMSEARLTPDREIHLLADFQPGPWDVICSRGMVSFHNGGNIRLRKIIDECLEEYLHATKSERVGIVSRIIDRVLAKSSVGFVRQDPDTKRWFKASRRVAREKVGQALRAALKKKGMYQSRKMSDRSLTSPSRAEGSNSSPSASPIATKSSLPGASRGLLLPTQSDSAILPHPRSSPLSALRGLSDSSLPMFHKSSSNESLPTSFPSPSSPSMGTQMEDTSRGSLTSSGRTLTDPLPAGLAQGSFATATPDPSPNLSNQIMLTGRNNNESLVAMDQMSHRSQSNSNLDVFNTAACEPIPIAPSSSNQPMLGHSMANISYRGGVGQQPQNQVPMIMESEQLSSSPLNEDNSMSLFSLRDTTSTVGGTRERMTQGLRSTVNTSSSTSSSINAMDPIHWEPTRQFPPNTGSPLSVLNEPTHPPIQQLQHQQPYHSGPVSHNFATATNNHSNLISPFPVATTSSSNNSRRDSLSFLPSYHHPDGISNMNQGVSPLLNSPTMTTSVFHRSDLVDEPSEQEQQLTMFTGPHSPLRRSSSQQYRHHEGLEGGGGLSLSSFSFDGGPTANTSTSTVGASPGTRNMEQEPPQPQDARLRYQQQQQRQEHWNSHKDTSRRDHHGSSYS